jgi:hypothetical protein
MNQHLLSMENSVLFAPLSVERTALEDENPNHNCFLEERSNMMESTTTTPAPPSSNNKNMVNDSPFYETSPTDVMDMDQHDPRELDSTQSDSSATTKQNVEHDDQNNNNNNSNMMKTATTTTGGFTKDKEEPPQESEYDAIAREAAFLLDKKLENTRAWTKKLLREITVYVKTLEGVQKEYVRVQGLEHQESDRLDQVEPDVQGATSHLLEHPFLGGSQALLAASIPPSYSRNDESIIPGGKRKKREQA